MAELAVTMGQAASALGIDRFNLWGSSFGGSLALWLAVQQPERITALVLAAPAAIRPQNAQPPTGSPEHQAALMFAHPDRRPPIPPPDPAIVRKQMALVARLLGPARDPELESQLPNLTVPVLVLIGTEDRVIPPEAGRVYRQLLPNCHFVLVYDAAHAVDADRPEAFASLVTEFLTRHEQFVVKRESALINP
jgi:pimeloyl-ACP methyl ester carboxylesterase